MPERRTFFVVNPRSANGATGRAWYKMARQISQALGEVDHAFTERPMHAAELTRRALAAGFETIVAVGGDGTVHEVLNGFFPEPDAAGAGDKPLSATAALAVLPRGTGGDFRRSLGLDLELGSALAMVKAGRTKPCDVGRARFRKDDGKDGWRYFLNEGSFGLSGATVHVVNHTSKLLGPKLTFFLGSIRALIGYKDCKVRVALDGGPSEELTITCVTAANGRYFGGGMMVAPEAKLDDGKLSVTIWTGFGLGAFMKHQSKLYDGSHVKLAGTRVAVAKRLSAESDELVRVDLDGEQPGTLPCEYDILPGAIQLVC